QKSIKYSQYLTSFCLRTHKTVAKIIFFIYPILRCIGGLPAKVTPLSLTHQENHKKSASYQQITTKSIVNYNY
ncbi:hypothetical protein KTQ96_12150, partial [Prevotella copri]